MENMLSAIKYFMAVTAVFAYVVSCTEHTVEVTSVELNQTELELEPGQTALLEADVVPDNATDKSVSWRSANDAVATVDQSGLVTAVSEGITEIIAKAGEVEDVCTLSVRTSLNLPSLINIGDFLLADGTILSKDTDEAIVRQADVIGIVFSKNIAGMSDYDKDYLESKGAKYPRGFAMALKDAADNLSVAWYSDLETGAYLRDETEIGFTDALVEGDSYGTFELSDADFSGFEKTCLVKEFRTDAYNAGYYPAMLAADEYNDYVPVPENATPWYLPSCGQFFEIIRNFADIRFDESNMLPINDDDFMWENITGIVGAINASMDKVSDNLKDPVNDTGVYWTSTTSSSTQARYVYLDNGWSVICMKANKNESYLVRPILTFGSF